MNIHRYHKWLGQQMIITSELTKAFSDWDKEPTRENRVIFKTALKKYNQFHTKGFNFTGK